MKVAHLFFSHKLSNVESYVLTLGESQKRAGYEVHYISPKIHLSHEGRHHSEILKPKGLFSSFRNTLELKKFIQNHGIEILHCHCPETLRLALNARSSTTSIIATAHTPWKQPANLKCDRLLPITPAIEEYFKRGERIENFKVRTIPPLQASLPEIHHRPKGPIKMAWIGAFEGSKSWKVQNLIENILPRILEAIPDFEFHLIGDELGALPITVHKAFLNLQKKYDGRLIHISHLSELDKAITNYTIVLSSGRVALMALMMKLRVIIIGQELDLGALRDTNWKPAFLTYFGDVAIEPWNETPSSYPEDFPLPKSTDELIDEILEEIREARLQPHGESSLRLKCLQHFSEEDVRRHVDEIYRSVRFQNRHPAIIPVLRYPPIVHDSFESPKRDYIHESRFQSHIRTLRESGFEPITFLDLHKAKRINEFALPAKPILITIDEVDSPELALQILVQEEFKATFFIDSSSPFAQEIKKAGMEIGSKGLKMEKIEAVTEADLYYELSSSKETLEKKIDQPIYVCLLKNDLFHETQARIARRVGYEFAVRDGHGCEHIENNPLFIKRIFLQPEEDAHQLKLKLKIS